MIEELSIRIKDGGLTHTISIDTDIDGNLPHDIACAIEEVVHLTSVNPEIIIEQLVEVYGMPESLKKSTYENIEYVTWHKPDVVPNVKEPIYVVFEDDKEPFIINDIYKDGEWLEYTKEAKVKEWCYLNDLLKEGYKI